MRRFTQRAIPDRDELVLNVGNGHGSTSTRIRRFTTTVRRSGNGIAYPGDSATLGAVVTITRRGLYFISYADRVVAGQGQIGISVNSTELTTNVGSITAADRRAFTNNQANSLFDQASTVEYLYSGDVIRPHTDATPDDTTALSMLRIIRIG